MLRPPTPYDLKRQAERAEQQRASLVRRMHFLIASAFLLAMATVAYIYLQPALAERWAELAERKLTSDSLADIEESTPEAVPDVAPHEDAPPPASPETLASQHAELAIQHFDAKRYSQALEEYQAAIALDSKNPDLYAASGVVRLQLKNRPGALWDFGEALRLDEQHVYANHALARALCTASTKSERDGRTALLHARQAALATEERDPEVLIVLALAYAETGSFEEAIRILDKAAQLESTDPESAQALAELKTRFQQRKAFPLKDELLEANTSSASTDTSADLERSTARPVTPSPAPPLLDPGVSPTTTATSPPLAPPQEDPLQHKLDRIDAYFSQGTYSAVIELCSEILEQDSKDMRALEYRLAAYVESGDLSKAMDDISRALQLEPSNPEHYFDRARVYTKKGVYHRALSDYEAAVRLAPKESAAWNNLAWIRATCYDLSIQDGKKALEAAQKAADLDNWQSHGTFDTLAAAYAVNGDYEEARHYQKTALELLDGPDRTQYWDQYLERRDLYDRDRPYRMPGVPPANN